MLVCEYFCKVEDLALNQKLGVNKMGKIKKKKRIGKIGAFVVLGIFMTLMLAQPVTASYIVMGDDEWIGFIGGAQIIFDSTPATDEIEMMNASVGIGDKSPDARLDVLHTTTGDCFRVDDSTDGDTTPFIIDADGDVGIGTASPSLGKLQIDTSPFASCALYIANPMGMAVNNGAINIGGNLFIDEDEIQSAVGRTLYINYDNDVDLIINNGGGNVGIGVTNPTDKLEIDGNVKFNTGANRYLYVEVPDTNHDGYDLTVEAGDGYCTGGSGKDGGELILRGGDGDAWGQYNSDGGNVYIYGGDRGVDGNVGDVILAHTGSAIRGYVGIGTTNPINPLDITHFPGPQLRLTNTYAVDYATFNVDSDGQLEIQTADGGGSGGHISLMPDGNVGIQTLTPSTTLHVNGDVTFGAGSTLTIDVDDEVTVTHSYHIIDTSSSPDNLDKINGGDAPGQILILIPASGDTITIINEDVTGNIDLEGTDNYVMNDPDDTLVLCYNGSKWLELSRSNNG
jgi:hypothetical protein